MKYELCYAIAQKEKIWISITYWEYELIAFHLRLSHDTSACFSL